MTRQEFDTECKAAGMLWSPLENQWVTFQRRARWDGMAIVTDGAGEVLAMLNTVDSLRESLQARTVEELREQVAKLQQDCVDWKETAEEIADGMGAQIQALRAERDALRARVAELEAGKVAPLEEWEDRDGWRGFVDGSVDRVSGVRICLSDPEDNIMHVVAPAQALGIAAALVRCAKVQP